MVRRRAAWSSTGGLYLGEHANSGHEQLYGSEWIRGELQHIQHVGRLDHLGIHTSDANTASMNMAGGGMVMQRSNQTIGTLSLSVPEPSTIFGGVLLLGWNGRRKLTAFLGL